MSVTVGDLLVKLALENSQYKAELEKSRRQTEADTDYMAQGTEMVGKAWQVAGPLVVAALAAVGTATVAAVQMGSDLNETVNKTAVVFGTASQDIVSFSENTAGALGQSQQAALDAASTFGIFGKSAGLAGDDLSDFSIDLTSLASDLASFHNASPEEAVVALGAALRGESEPIRRFGVLLDEATLKQEALRMGLISTTSTALTPQQKVLASYNVIMAQTADAQGDFARTSDGLANTQRILTAELTDLATEWGSALLPVVQEFASEAMPVLIDGLDVLTTAHLPAFVTLIGQTADGLLTAFEAGMLLVTWTERIDTAFAEHEQSLITVNTTYDEYINEVMRAMVVSGEYGQYEADWVLNKIALGESIQTQADAYGFLTPEMYRAMQAALELEDAETKLAIARSSQAPVILEVATATTTLTTNSTLLRDAMSALAVDGFNPAATAAALLKDGIDAITESAVEAERITLVLAIAEKMRAINTGDLTQAQKEQLTAELSLLLNQQTELQNMEKLNQAYEAGQITKYDWIDAVSDGVVTEYELNKALGITNDELSDEEANLIGVNTTITEKGLGAMTDYREKLMALEEPLMTSSGLLSETADEAGALNDRLNAMPSSITIDINLETHGSLPDLPGQGEGQGGTSSTTWQMAGGFAEAAAPVGEPLENIDDINRQFSQLSPWEQAMVESMVWNEGVDYAEAVQTVASRRAAQPQTDPKGRAGYDASPQMEPKAAKGRAGFEIPPLSTGEQMSVGRGSSNSFQMAGGEAGYGTGYGVQIYGDIFVAANDPASFLEQLYALQNSSVR